MYKIIYRNTETYIEMVEYGFARHLGKRLYLLLNEQESKYEIEWFLKITFSWTNFIKCLTNYSKRL